MTTPQRHTLALIALSGALGINPSPLSAQPAAPPADEPDTPRQAPAEPDQGGLYDNERDQGDDNAPREQPDALEELEAIPLGETIELGDGPAVYKLHTQRPGMLTLVVAARGGAPSLIVESAAGTPLVGLGPEAEGPQGRNRVRNNELVIRGPGFHHDGLGYKALTPDGSNIAYTLHIQSAGSYKITLAATNPDEEESPFASAQWLDLPTPEEQRQQAADQPPPAPELDADTILKQATALTPGLDQALDAFDAQDSEWLVFTPEQTGILVLTARSDDADVMLEMHRAENLADPFLHVDSDRGGDVGNEATILPVTADQTLLIRVRAYGNPQGRAVRVRAVFVPEQPADADPGQQRDAPADQ